MTAPDIQENMVESIKTWIQNGIPEKTRFCLQQGGF